MKILISGASGLLGSQLKRFFKESGAQVFPITRVVANGSITNGVAWNPSTGWFDCQAMEGTDTVIHLAGENVATGPWTKRKKARIHSSRVQGTGQLVSAISQLKNPPKTFFCASATGFYGNTGEVECRETHTAGKGFLASVCVDWEREAQKARTDSTRVVLLRFGVILDPSGGALKKMLLPFRLGLGGRIGSGKQYFPWIAAPEIPRIIDSLIHHYPNLSGPVNMVAPQAVTNAIFTKTLARHLKRPALIPVPELAVKALFGEMGKEMFLGSCQAIPSALEQAGYSFAYPNLDATFQSLFQT